MDKLVNDVNKANELGWRVVAANTFSNQYGLDGNDEGPITIQFEEPINICEIYVLSPSLYLLTTSSDFIVGETYPTEMPISFHCNNVDVDSASANVKLGELNYEENISMSMQFSNEIWTNRLIVSADDYSVLTIAVYGKLKNPNAKVQKKPFSNLPPLGAEYLNGIYSLGKNYILSKL